MQIRTMTVSAVLVVLLSLIAQNIEMRRDLSTLRKAALTQGGQILTLAQIMNANADSLSKVAQILNEHAKALNEHTQTLRREDRTTHALIAAVRTLEQRQEIPRMLFPPAPPTNLAPVSSASSILTPLRKRRNFNQLEWIPCSRNPWNTASRCAPSGSGESCFRGLAAKVRPDPRLRPGFFLGL